MAGDATPDGLQAPGIVSLFLKHLYTDGGEAVAMAILDDRLPARPGDLDRTLARGAAMLQLGAHEAAAEQIETVLRCAPDRTDAHVLKVRLFAERGLAADALDAIDAIPAPAEHRARLRRELFPDPELLDMVDRYARTDGETVADIALRGVLQTLPDAPPNDPHRLGNVVMLTGSLGRGGAERQFARTAAAIARMIRGGESVGGTPLDGSVQVTVRSLTSRVDADFFAPLLEAEQVPVTSLAGRKWQRPRLDIRERKRRRKFLALLPQRLAWGYEVIGRDLRDRRCDCLYVWQDGMVLPGVLGAMRAGVPRIVANLRGMPPSEARLPQLRDSAGIYRQFLDQGVTFCFNSHQAQLGYAEWMGREPFGHVIRNGVTPLPVDPAVGDEAMWRAFDENCERGAGAGPVVGTVIRFDDNKRPMLWIDSAKQLLRLRPDARFVMVGDGPLLERTKAAAVAHGIADRVLFVGSSRSVGYWLDRMDIFLLLSRSEGTPNAVIEAMLAGCPVIASNVGGLPDVLDNGVTGKLVNTDVVRDPMRVAAEIIEMLHEPEETAERTRAARVSARERFQFERMVERTVRILAGDAA